MDVCMAPSSPPLFFESVSAYRPSSNNNNTPYQPRSSRSRLTISPIHLQLSSPRLPRVFVSPSTSPSPKQSVKTPAPQPETRSSLFCSQPAPAPMGLKTPTNDPDARNLFPVTPQPPRSQSFATNMKSKIPILQVSEASGGSGAERKGMPRPGLNRNSSSLNDVKQSFTLHSAKAEQVTRVRRKSSVGRRPSTATGAPGSARHVGHRRNDSNSSRPRAVGNIFNVTVPPDRSTPSGQDDSPFLDRDTAASEGDDRDDDDDEEDGAQIPPSPTTSAVPESFSNSSLLSLSASTSSLPPPTPDDLDSELAHSHEKHLDASSNYFNKVLPLQAVFQPTTIAKKYKGPGRRGSDAHLHVSTMLNTNISPNDAHTPTTNFDDSLVTPSLTPHPSWPSSNIAAALRLPAPPVPPTPAHPIMPPTPTKRPNVHFSASVGPTKSSAFLVRLKDVIAKEGPGTAPQAPRARSHKPPRPSLPNNMPSYASFSGCNMDSPETSPSIRTAQRHAKAHREPVGAWPRKSSAFERRIPEEALSHPRRELLRRTSSSASAWSDASSSGETAISDDSQDVDMLTPTRGPGGRLAFGSGLTRTPAVDMGLGLQRTASEEYPSPPETSPLIERAARVSAAAHHHANQHSTLGRVSLNPAILRTPASPEANLGVPQSSVIRGRHSFPFVKSDEGAVGRFARDFIQDGQLGRGGFGLTYRVMARFPAPGEEGKVWCIKRRKTPFEGAKDRQRQLEETDILQYLASPVVGGPHPYIVQMIDFWEESNTLFLRTELCGLGDLSILLQEFGRISEEGLGEARVWKILNEITKGLTHVHRAGILHLDLKPANIFITDNGVLKIGDFGLATRWPRPNAALERGFEREGDREYMAPEILRGVYGKPADIFSLGVLTLECVCNIVVPDMGEPWHKLRTDDFSDTELSSIASYEMASFIVGMMHSARTLRPSIEQIRSNLVFHRLEAMIDAGMVGSAIEPEDATFLADLLGHSDPSSPAGDAMDVDL